jgi:hypothetical protein
MLGPTEMFVVLAILLVLFVGKSPRELASDLQDALYRLRYCHPRPRPELRGLEWLVLAVALLFFELIWLAHQY